MAHVLMQLTPDHSQISELAACKTLGIPSKQTQIDYSYSLAYTKPHATSTGRVRHIPPQPHQRRDPRRVDEHRSQNLRLCSRLWIDTPLYHQVRWRRPATSYLWAA